MILFNEMTYDQKQVWLRSLNKARIRELFASAGTPRDWRTSIFGQTNARVPKSFMGKNSLPVFNSFQKSFFAADDGQIYGFNTSWIGRKLGYPGYFKVGELASGELLFDYTARFPDSVLETRLGFPTDRFVSNENLLFAGLQDVVRDLGNGVYVGEAFKLRSGVRVPLGVHFVLVSERIEFTARNSRAA